jgi:hypothetical protein
MPDGPCHEEPLRVLKGQLPLSRACVRLVNQPLS